MSWEVGLPLLLAALVAFVVIGFSRRAGAALARSRELARFRRDSAGLAERAEALLGPLIARVDAVRHHQLPPGEVEPELQSGLEALGLLAGEARELGAPGELHGHVAAAADELEHARRAVEMVLHGCRMAGGAGGRSTELEGQTSIKRGYLNLLHARDAVREHALRAQAAAEAVREGWRRPRI
ncbi:MAG TPA: hypothetical protein VFK38_07180 [Candidatus Limnocylindrales bacterium]|nr:hypothetical protein [Candidatus Limnocylindrales bacterium]